MANEWLSNLKAGDRVVVTNNWGERVQTVARVTATQIVCANSRFRRSNGYSFGGPTWDRTRLIPPTTEILERIEERSLREKIKRIAKDKATTLASLRAMFTATKEPQA